MPPPSSSRHTRAGPSVVKLPDSIVKEMEGGEQDDSRRNRLHRPQVSRKELRKQERQGRKQRKAVFFAAAPPAGSKRAAQEDHPESPQRKKAKPTPPVVVTASIPPPKALKPAKKPAVKAQTALEKRAGRSEPTVLHLPGRSKQDRDEDAYIAELEAKLGYKRGKKSKNAEDDDGLDDLMDLATSVMNSAMQPKEDIGMDGSDTLSDEDVEEGSEQGLSEDESVESESDGDRNADDSEEEWQGIQESEPKTIVLPQPVAGNRYVPPAMRKLAEKEDEKNAEEMLKLTRQLKGLLNRMSEQNMGNILESIEEIYRNYRRADVTSTLTTLIIDGISAHSSHLDSFVVLYAAFVSSLHKIIGVEFAAYFTQNAVACYEKHHAALQDNPSEDQGKECSNTIVLLSELYNFQVISCVLVFDLIRGLLATDLSEFNVELLLKIVRNSGQQLRTDDPSALKDIIEIVQTKLSEQDDDLSSRTRFMVETLSNLKNNKAKRNITQNQGGDAVERMKRFLTALTKKRHVLAHEPLRVSLNDLHSAESKGKWWLVGAAWGGDPLVDRQDKPKPTKLKPTADELADGALLKLARKQGMNTDIRRSIFVVLMSSDDYVDACERLAQLNLTEVQQREIIRVILHCCGNEKSYNPYYTLVCQHLCKSSHSYKVTIQFCLWDFLRDLGETSVGGAEVIKNLAEDDGFDAKLISPTRMMNVAKAYGWWIAKDCVTLAVLKPVDFTALKPQTHEFLTELFTQLFISTQVGTPLISADVPTTRNRTPVEEVFMKATRIDALAMGIVCFLGEVYRDSGSSAKLTKWAGSVALDALRSGVQMV